MKVTTWNVNSLRARLDHVVRFTREEAPDVLCLQETKLVDELFPREVLGEWYPYLAWWGQPTYNGVAVLSKRPLEDVQRGFRGWEDPEARVLGCTVSGIRIYGLYVPNGTSLGSPRFHHKLRWLQQLRTELDRHPEGSPLMVVGDMNVAPDDLDVWDPFKCDGQLLCTREERAALQHALDWGLTDAFRHQNPYANDFSWWDYQKLGFQRNHGLRIDHAFLSPPLMERLEKVTIHRAVRGWDQPSDHAPVSVDLRE